MEVSEKDMELQILREQMRKLNEKLACQEIISSRAALDSVKGQLDVINRRQWRALVRMGLLGVTCLLCLMRMRLPLWFDIVTALFFAIAIFYDIRTQMKAGIHPTGGESMLEAARGAERRQRAMYRWLWFGIPFGVAWIGVFSWLSVSLHASEPGDYKFLLAGVFAGLVLGSLAGLRYFRDEQNRLSRLRESIRELENGTAL